MFARHRQDNAPGVSSHLNVCLPFNLERRDLLVAHLDGLRSVQFLPLWLQFSQVWIILSRRIDFRPAYNSKGRFGRLRRSRTHPALAVIWMSSSRSASSAAICWSRALTAFSRSRFTVARSFVSIRSCERARRVSHSRQSPTF